MARSEYIVQCLRHSALLIFCFPPKTHFHIYILVPARMKDCQTAEQALQDQLDNLQAAKYRINDQNYTKILVE